MIDLGKLRLFYIVAQEGSVSKAARRLNTSQPALSEHIMNFEHRLKVKLFKRVSTGMKLTPEGEKLLSYAEEVMKRNEAFSKEFYGQDTLKIITTPFLGTEWLIDNLADFLKQHPLLAVKIILESDDIPSVDADVAICTFLHNQGHLIQKPLFTANIRLFAHPSYLEKFGMPRTVEDLDHHHLIAYRDSSYYSPYGSTNWILNVGIAPGQNARIPYIEVDSLQGMFKSAQAGLGITEFPDYSMVSETELVEVLPDLVGPQVHVHYIFSKFRQDSHKINALFDYLVRKGK